MSDADSAPDLPPEILAAFASVTAITGMLRAFYVALVSDGFSSDQAMTLTINYMQLMLALAQSQAT